MQSYSGPVHEWTYVDIELMIIIISKTLRDAMEREYPQKLFSTDAPLTCCLPEAASQKVSFA